MVKACPSDRCDAAKELEWALQRVQNLQHRLKKAKARDQRRLKVIKAYQQRTTMLEDLMNSESRSHLVKELQDKALEDSPAPGLAKPVWIGCQVHLATKIDDETTFVTRTSTTRLFDEEDADDLTSTILVDAMTTWREIEGPRLRS